MSGTMRTIQLDKFVEEEDEVEWLVEELLTNIGWTLFYGPAGVGKTRFAIQLCVALEHGRDFLGRKTRKTHVLYVQADSPSPEWRLIVKSIAPKGSKSITMVDVPRGVLGNAKYVEYIQLQVEKVNPGFVVFDSLYNLAVHDINNPNILLDIGLMSALCQGKPWLLIHHPPHGMARASGSNSIGAGCSNDWALAKNSLRINKGRLLANTSIPLRMSEKGVWEALQRKPSGDSATIDDIMKYRIR